jgi:hypothetical protein
MRKRSTSGLPIPKYQLNTIIYCISFNINFVIGDAAW